MSQYVLLSPGEACEEYVVKGADVAWSVVDVATGRPVATGTTRTDTAGHWGAAAVFATAGTYRVEADITDHTLSGGASHQFDVASCGGSEPPSPPYAPPSGGGATAPGGGVVVPGDGGSSGGGSGSSGDAGSNVVYPGGVIPLYLGGPGTPGWDPSSPGTGPRGTGPDFPAEAFDAWVYSVDISFSNEEPVVGDSVVVEAVIHGNNAYFGLPISLHATYPTAGTAPIAPTAWYYLNGDLRVSTIFRPLVRGDFIVEVEIGPEFHDANDGNNAATRVLRVGPHHPPVLAPIGDRLVREGETLQFVVDAWDPDGDPLVFSATNLPSGATFDTGTRTFSWTPSFEQAGAYPGARFAVTDGIFGDVEVITISVIDVNRPPVARGEDVVTERTGCAGADLVLDGSASTDPDSVEGVNDIIRWDWYVDGALIASGDRAAATFPLGEHEVTLVVTDTNGLSSIDLVSVLVFDDTPPSLSLAIADDALWPPNHAMIDVGLVVAIDDECPGSVVSSIRVTSDEPTATAPGAGGAVHAPDAIIDGTIVRLRAERSGVGDGRVYVVTTTIIDDAGAVVARSIAVRVDHDQRHDAVDSGQLFDATLPN